VLLVNVIAALENLAAALTLQQGYERQGVEGPDLLRGRGQVALALGAKDGMVLRPPGPTSAQCCPPHPGSPRRPAATDLDGRVEPFLAMVAIQAYLYHKICASICVG
jgi:hypothetical protein